MLRYGLRELLLVQPETVVLRPAPDPGAPHVRAALERAERDRREGRRGFKDWSEADQRAWMNAPHALEASAVYHAARHPHTLSAPAPWPQELGLLVAEGLVAAAGGRIAPPRVASVPWAATLAGGLVATNRLRERAERRQARRLGLRAESAPRVSASGFLLFLATVSTADALWRWRRRPERYPWMLETAAYAIRALNRRRAWQRAYRARETSVPSVQSSASP